MKKSEVNLGFGCFFPGTEREQVTELARQNGFSLVSTADGQIGWVKSNLIVSYYR